MRVDIPPGKYVLAVSGGVDSMVLLHLLNSMKDVEIVVAHFDHGIRSNSNKDAVFVANVVDKFMLRFELGKAKLGPDASENLARTARYNFLSNIKDKHEASGIITAHHQDDLIETALINILRGTGPRGLVAMSVNKEILRPLLGVSKKGIIKYAEANGISWVEDSSNDDSRYLRNRLRKMLVERLTDPERMKILEYVDQVVASKDETDELMNSINSYLFEDQMTIKRNAFIFLPNEVATEVLVRWFRDKKISVDRQAINRLLVAIKTGRPNTLHNIDKRYKLKLNASQAHLIG
jgi:tRNA(Ile)-lysidine synthetase-like protein